MQREQEAVAWCPVRQLCGGKLMPDPPDAAGAAAATGVAAEDYAEFKLQLLDFSQARAPCWRQCPQLTCFLHRKSEACMLCEDHGAANAGPSTSLAVLDTCLASRPAARQLMCLLCTSKTRGDAGVTAVVFAGAGYDWGRAGGQAHGAQGGRRVPHRLPAGGQQSAGPLQVGRASRVGGGRWQCGTRVCLVGCIVLCC